MFPCADCMAILTHAGIPRFNEILFLHSTTPSNIYFNHKDKLCTYLLNKVSEMLVLDFEIPFYPAQLASIFPVNTLVALRDWFFLQLSEMA